MPKPLKIALILVFILAIFAPKGHILAQEGPSEGGTSYLPSHTQWSQTMGRLPLRIANFFKKAIPFTPEQWQGATRAIVLALKDAVDVENFKNFFGDARRVLGNIKDFFVSVYHEFY